MPRGRAKSAPSARGHWPAACTIIAGNYLAQARVLADSYTRHHPGATFYILLVDQLPPQASEVSEAILIDLDELGVAAHLDMQVKYSVLEFSTAVKPSLLSHLAERYGETEVIYLDPDILVMRPFEELRVPWATADVVLTPHLLEPIPHDGCGASERSILIAGGYNLGFMAVRDSRETRRFLHWWAGHLQVDCRVDPCQGLMVDQRWIDLAPHLFPSSFVSLRDDTYNVAYWNIKSRALDFGGEGGFLVNGRPLTFFHFSGFDPAKPRQLSAHEHRIKITDGTPLADLVDLYAGLLMERGFAESSKWPYGANNLLYGCFDNGIPTNAILHALYAGLEPAARARFGDPRRTTGPDSFFTWATAPRPRAGGLSRFLEAVYQRRPDVAAVYPDPGGLDRPAFLQWARQHGAAEMQFDHRLVHDDGSLDTC